MNFKIYLFIIIAFLIGANIYSADFKLSTQNNGKIDRWITCDVYKDWQKLDINKNGKSDESCFFVSEKKVVYLISEEKLDSLEKGKPNIFMKINLKGSTFFRELKIDTKGDGKFDMYRYEENDKVYLEKYDENYDGKFDRTLEYDKEGNKTKESLDKITPDESEIDFFENNIIAKLNNDNKKIVQSCYIKEKNRKAYLILRDLSAETKTNLNKALTQIGYNDEKMDKFFYFDKKGNVTKEEYDTVSTGKIDMWVLYEYDAKDGSIKQIVIQKDNNHDGKPDEWQYTDKKRRVVKIEKDTKFNGTKDYVKKYE